MSMIGPLRPLPHALLAALGATALAAQQPPAVPPDQPPVTFRVEVNYVEVDAFVTDAAGRVVTDLTEADFEVFEDGRRQTVASFALVNLPIERVERPLFAVRPVEADVQSNRTVEGRIYLIVLDDNHTDYTRAPRVKAAARRFIEQNFGVNDLAAVVFTGGRAEDAQDFTNNRRLLLAAIDRFVGRKLRSPTLERLEGLRINPATGGLEAPDDPSLFERGYRARSAMAAIRNMAEFMAGVRGRRKAMLLIGEGIDYDIRDVMGVTGATASAVLQETQEAIAAATRGNVSIYSIDPRGLTAGTEDLIAAAGTGPDQDLGVRSALTELRLSQDSLRVLAANTGGFAAVNQNDFDSAFDRIVAENSSYYMLGYYAGNARREGRYRRIEVRVRRPGLRVRSRDGYYEARGRRPSDAPPAPSSVSRAVADALGSPIPVKDVAMKVFAAPFRGETPNAAVAIAVEIDASTLDLVEKNGVFVDQLQVVVSATDARGRAHPGDRHTVNLNLRPDTYKRALAAGLRVLSQVTLPHGRYQLRVAAGTQQGRAGSVVFDLEVPEFAGDSLSMSGVALTSSSAGQTPTIRPRDPLADFLPGPPTAAREFRRGDGLALFAEFYEPASSGPAHRIDLKAELRAEGGAVVRSVVEERTSAELQGRAGGYGFSARIALDDVEPGLYVLRVEGQSRASGRAGVGRDIQIRVR
jgi:VWFA-related protein